MTKPIFMRFPRGVDQVSAETRLSPGTARRIVNLDVHQGAVSAYGQVTGGRLSRRSQVKQAIAGLRTHSLWAGDLTACYVAAGDLNQIGPNLTPSLLRAGVGEQEMFYAELGGVTFFSNGAVAGTVVNGVAAPWGLPVPSMNAPTALAFGGMAAGTYMVSCTYHDASGQESGAAPARLVDVLAGGGISLPLTASTLTTRVYVSGANDENLYWAQDVAPGGTAAFLGAHTPGKMLTTMHMEAPSGWTHLEGYKGRVYGVAGNALVATQALNYGLTRPSTDFILFQSAPVMVKAVNNGIYVGTQTEVVFLNGDDLKTFRFDPADSMPPIPGSGMFIDGALFDASPASVVWLTRRGWVLGSDSGQVKRLTESQMALPDYDRAAGLYREHDGMRQVLTFVKGGGEAAGASDSYSTEIVRNGLVI